MARKLREDDARVVDMLLDRGESSDGGAQVFTNPQPEMVTRRFQSVERLLKVLDQMPAAEPPMDLVSRTLDFIEEATTTGRRARPSAGHAGHGERPSA